MSDICQIGSYILDAYLHPPPTADWSDQLAAFEVWQVKLPMMGAIREKEPDWNDCLKVME